MRIKFLSVIVSFLIASITVSSCLDSNENYEYSSDATIHAFGLDTVYGKHYSFSIDHLERVIFNKDSLPVGADTIIDRILIDTMTVAGWITSGEQDTVFNMKDSVDLRPAMNNDIGMKFRVHAADMLTIREYTLKVNVHKQDPDSLVWKNMREEGAVFNNTATTGEQRSVLLNNDLLVYTTNTTVYKTSTTPYQYKWTEASVSNLPLNAKLTSVINFEGKLYMTTGNGDVYASSNGTVWEKVNGLSTNIIALVACFESNEVSHQPATLVGISHNNTDGKNYFCNTSDGLMWTITENVPSGFPTENIYATSLTTANGVEKVVVVGMPRADEKQTVPWFSLDGEGWASLSTTSNTFCPGMANPSIMHYGGQFYCFGGTFDAIYSSKTGIAWYQTKKKFLLPKEVKGKEVYSMTIDKNNFIWIVFGGKGTQNEVWRGRLNKLGFKQQ